MTYLFEMNGLLIVFLLAVMVFSGLVHGTLGLGFPMVATPIIAIFLDVRTAILLTLVPTVVVNVATIYGGERQIEYIRRFFPLVVFSLVGSLAGAYLLASVDPNPFRLLLALLILVFLFSQYLGKLPREWLETHHYLAMTAFGLLAGISAGTTNVMVAILLVYFLSLELPRPNMVPILNACFLVGKIAQIIVFTHAGMVSAVSALQGVPLAVAALGALLVGQRLRSKIPTHTYRRILKGLLVILACILLVQFSMN